MYYLDRMVIFILLHQDLVTEFNILQNGNFNGENAFYNYYTQPVVENEKPLLVFIQG